MAAAIQPVTYRTLKRLPRTSEDDNNLTMSNRDIHLYFEQFPSATDGLKAFLDECVLLGRKIKVLDCGAGQGCAIDSLLSGDYGDIVSKCTGVSLHYFSNVRQLLAKHQDKIEWIIGNAVTVLPQLPSEYDLILDVFGAYFYFPHRPELLREYHRLLAPDGRSFVHLAGRNRIVGNKLKFSEKLEFELHKRSPETFSMPKNKVFTIRKRRRHYPGVSAKIIRRNYKSSIYRSEQVSKRGNGWYPRSVTYRLD